MNRVEHAVYGSCFLRFFLLGGSFLLAWFGVGFSFHAFVAHWCSDVSRAFQSAKLVIFVQVQVKNFLHAHF
mgnify:CR=1 FL=1